MGRPKSLPVCGRDTCEGCPFKKERAYSDKTNSGYITTHDGYNDTRESEGDGSWMKQGRIAASGDRRSYMKRVVEHGGYIWK
jgi:hypothetical protein